MALRHRTATSVKISICRFFKSLVTDSLDWGADSVSSIFISKMVFSYRIGERRRANKCDCIVVYTQVGVNKAI